MTIIAFNHYWVIRWHWLLLNLFAVGILIGLAIWQWQRGEEKEKTLARVAEWQAKGSLNADALKAMSPAQLDGVHLQMPVRWLAPVVWLLDNRVYQGRIGYDVVIPVAVERFHQPVIVNLGWVEAPAQRSDLPMVEVPGDFYVDGILRTRTGGLLLGQNLESSNSWPQRIQQVEFDQLYASLPTDIYQEYQDLYPGIVYQQQGTRFISYYRPVVMPPEKHRAYALQWALLALAVTIIALVASARRREAMPKPPD